MQVVSEEKDKMADQYGLRATNSGLRISHVFNLTFAIEHSSSTPSSNQPGEGDASLRDHALIEADQEMPCAESQPRTAFPPTFSFIRQTTLRCVPRGIEADFGPAPAATFRHGPLPTSTPIAIAGFCRVRRIR